MIGHRWNGIQGKPVILAGIILVGGIVLLGGAMPVGAGDNPAIEAERSIESDTNVPGGEVEVLLEVEILEAGSELDLVDEVNPPGVPAGIEIVSIEAPFDPVIAEAGANGVVVIWDKAGWEPGHKVTIEYVLSTAPEQEHGDTVTLTSVSEYDGELYDIDGQDSVNIEADDPATYELRNLVVPATVTEGGEPIDIEVDVDNTGDAPGKQDIRLELRDAGNKEVYSDVGAEYELAPGTQERIVFEKVPVGDLDPGTYSVRVLSADDALSETVTIGAQELTPAAFQLVDLYPAMAEFEASEGPIEVSATVENRGELTGTQDIELTVFNEFEEVVYTGSVEAVELDEDETTTITFDTVPITEFEGENYTVEVTSEDDEIIGQWTVVEDDTFLSDPTPGFGPIAAIIVLFTAALALRGRS